MSELGKAHTRFIENLIPEKWLDVALKLLATLDSFMELKPFSSHQL